MRHLKGKVATDLENNAHLDIGNEQRTRVNGARNSGVSAPRAQHVAHQKLGLGKCRFTAADDISHRAPHSGINPRADPNVIQYIR